MATVEGVSLRLRFFAIDADDDPSSVALLSDGVLDEAERAAFDGPPGVSPGAPAGPIVHLASLSASDADEDELAELCALLETTTGFDFSSAARSVVPMEHLASFSDAVARLRSS